MSTATATPVYPVITDAPTIRLSDQARQCYLNSAARVAPRRIRVLLDVTDRGILRGHTSHVGVDRLTLSVPHAIAVGQECAVFFGLSIEDQLYSIVGTGKVLHCGAQGDDGFRAELSFAPGDKKSLIALEQLFGTKQSTCVQ